MKSEKFELIDQSNFKYRALHFACDASPYVFFLENNKIPYKYGAFPQVLAFGEQRLFTPEKEDVFEELKTFHDQAGQNIYGYFSYDLKNETENLVSQNPDHVGFPLCRFIEPGYEILFNDREIEIRSVHESPLEIFNKIQKFAPSHFIAGIPSIDIQCRFTKEDYTDVVNEIKRQIVAGNIYELNFCIEFFAQNIEIDPINAFLTLNDLSPMPFASFLKWEDKYAICASPERFLKKQADLLVSQPIKGTARRGLTTSDDERIKQQLENSEKERAENIMIVDLVRNDLSQTAVDGSVIAEEVCEVYSFRQVYQMISTVTSRLSPQKHFAEAIQKAFPMGSMTGAPKINAMKLIEKTERTQRGLFSGSIGYISSKGDFDFNVVIRTILYNESTGYLSFQAGSAITYDADAAREYEECLIKTKAIRMLLEGAS